MNNRDPFNLRRTSPLDFLQTTAKLATQTANRLQQASQRHFERIDIPSLNTRIIAAGGMASSSTRNWNAGTRARAQTISSATVSDKISRALSTEEDRSHELPMYKDKPYNYTASARNVPFLKNRRNRILLAVGGVLIVLLYFSGVLSSSRGAIEVSSPVKHAPEAAHYPVDKSKPKEKSKGSEAGEEKKGGRILGLGLPNILKGSSREKTPKQLDWNARRDKVKEAFQISWKAYEDHAWGESTAR